VLGAFGQWWQRLIEIRAGELPEGVLLCIGRVKYLAYYVGSADLRAFVRCSRNDANLLARRMVALGLDPYELTLSDPALVRHVQKQCTLCDNRECCLQAFAREPSGVALRDDWRDYCPNALALDMLVGLQSRSRTMAKSHFHILADSSTKTPGPFRGAPTEACRGDEKSTSGGNQ
jgi:hypothetical protein